LATVPTMSSWNLTISGSPHVAALRSLYGGEANNGKPSKDVVGNIDKSVDVLFVCGSLDP